MLFFITSLSLLSVKFGLIFLVVLFFQGKTSNLLFGVFFLSKCQISFESINIFVLW